MDGFDIKVTRRHVMSCHVKKKVWREERGLD